MSKRENRGIRRSIMLTKEQWLVIDGLAERLYTIATRGAAAGKRPSWRALWRMVGEGRLTIVPTPVWEALVRDQPDLAGPELDSASEALLYEMAVIADNKPD